MSIFRLILSRLPIDTSLHSSSISLVSRCSWCTDSPLVESLEHIFFRSQYEVKVWDHFYRLFGLMPPDISHYAHTPTYTLHHWSHTSSLSHLIHISHLVSFLSWFLWMAKRLLHEPEHPCSAFYHHPQSLQTHPDPSFRSLTGTVSPILQPATSYFLDCPQAGWVKLNTDGAFCF